jgi:hypothetical protein
MDQHRTRLVLFAFSKYKFKLNRRACYRPQIDRAVNTAWALEVVVSVAKIATDYICTRGVNCSMT